MENSVPNNKSLKIQKMREEYKWAFRTAISIGVNLILIGLRTGHQKLYLPETYVTYVNEYPNLALLQVLVIAYPILRIMLVSTKYQVLSEKNKNK